MSNMKQTEIQCKYENLKKEILPLLMGQVFHVTNKNSFKGIKKEGKINNNLNKQYKLTTAQSENNYGRKRGHVCLIDLRDINAQNLKDALMKYYFLSPHNEEDVYFLILKDECFNRLIPWQKAQEEVGYKEVWIPHVETWYPGDIDLSFVKEIICVVVEPEKVVDDGPWISMGRKKH